MARRRRTNQCSLCGDWIPYPYKGRKCQACKAPAVRAARRQLRQIRKLDRDERVIEEGEAA